MMGIPTTKEMLIGLAAVVWPEAKNIALCLLLAFLIGVMGVMFYQGIVLWQDRDHDRLGRYDGLEAISYVASVDR